MNAEGPFSGVEDGLVGVGGRGGHEAVRQARVGGAEAVPGHLLDQQPSQSLL